MRRGGGGRIVRMGVVLGVVGVRGGGKGVVREVWRVGVVGELKGREGGVEVVGGERALNRWLIKRGFGFGGLG